MNPREPSNFAHSKIFKNEFFQNFSSFPENREKIFFGNKFFQREKMKTFGVLAFVALAIGFLMLIWFGSAILKTFCCPTRVTANDPELGQVDPRNTESRDRIEIPGVWDRPPDYFEAIFDFPKPKQISKIEPKEKQPPTYPTTELYKNTPYFHRSISAPNFQKK